MQFLYANLAPAAGTQWISLNDISFNIIPTPEPSPFLLVSLGLIGFAAISRRKRGL